MEFQLRWILTFDPLLPLKVKTLSNPAIDDSKKILTSDIFGNIKTFVKSREITVSYCMQHCQAIVGLLCIVFFRGYVDPSKKGGDLLDWSHQQTSKFLSSSMK